MSEPREFFIRDLGFGQREWRAVCYDEEPPTDDDYDIHVIEYSAYQAKCEELEELKSKPCGQAYECKGLYDQAKREWCEHQRTKAELEEERYYAREERESWKKEANRLKAENERLKDVLGEIKKLSSGFYDSSYWKDDLLFRVNTQCCAALSKSEGEG